jgi:hypothetical protein
MQTATDAIAKANNITGPRLAQLTDLMEKVEDVLTSEPREIQISMLKSLDLIPVESLEKYAAESPDRFLSLLQTSIRFSHEAPILRILDTVVRMSDLQSEDLRATALRTLAEQAVGALPLNNPTLAAALTRGLPNQIGESIEQMNAVLIPVENFTPVTIQFRPEIILPVTGPDGVTRMTVWINAVIEGVNEAGLARMLYLPFSYPIDVVTPVVN